MDIPWWAQVIAGGSLVASSALNVLQFWKNKDIIRWKATSDSWERNAEAYKAERDVLTISREKLEAEIKRQAVVVAELRAKTDLDSVRETQLKILTGINEMGDKITLVGEKINNVGSQFIAALTQHSQEDSSFNAQLVNTLKRIEEEKRSTSRSSKLKSLK